MKAKLKILKKTTSTVNTKFGQKDKHAFQLEGSKGPFWADCFANSTTAGWREGDVQEMELAPREYQGKTYWNIVTPKPQDEMLVILKRIEMKLDKLLGQEVEPPPDIDDEPKDIDENGIPF